MRSAVVGLLAHVDAGKTTLAEALLYRAGTIRSLGRVDHGDAFLDFEAIERERGITIVSKPASVVYEDVCYTLLDAPGHVDFAAEAERTMQVLDAAVLVIAANEGVRGHTKTLWRLLEHYGVPTLVFVNKCDLAGSDGNDVLAGLATALSDGCVDYARVGDADVQETLAMADEGALEELLEDGCLSSATVQRLFLHREFFPCLFGAALRMDGIDDLLRALGELLPERAWPKEFGARVFKVSHGKNGERITWLRVMGGTLHAKEVLEGTMPNGDLWTNKVDQLRVYNGARYEVVREVLAGSICAVSGLAHTMPGSGLGTLTKSNTPVLSAVLDYAVQPLDCEPHALYEALRVLADEDPLLGVTWNEESQESRVQLMGAVQLEILQERLRNEAGIEVSFGAGSILYKETIAAPIEGVGHFEPLRHYAEVHVLLEPLPRGSGMQFGTVCMEDDLDRNWQRLILTNAMERPHKGVLIGAPITDMRITLVAGRAHAKHTEGGDFRQATYRAIRQGLMQAQSVLLEPWYSFELEVPAQKIGKALSDLQRMGAEFGAPTLEGDMAALQGRVPVSEVGEYALQVNAYTGGNGRLFLTPGGYEPCHNATEVVAQAAYDPEADLSHTPDSVFCSHGAGYTVKWRDVPECAHVAFDPARRRAWRAADESFFRNV